jgi:predicted GNAT family N-acyltransferase
MADLYDTRSRIIVGKYRGEVVGTIRLTFFEAGEKLEHERYLTLPEGFPKSHQILECSRAATSPDFRGSDLWTTLMQHIAIVALLAKREWVLISTTPELVAMYKRLGFKETGLTYEHELYPGKKQITLLINVPEAVMGIGVGPIYWNVVWRGVSRYLGDNGRLTPSTKARVYSLMAPLAEWLRYMAKHPRKRTVAPPQVSNAPSAA